MSTNNMSYNFMSPYGNEYESPSILAALGGNRVFDIEVKKGKIKIREGCDAYFELDLTVDQLETLGQEIIDLARKIKKYQ